MLMFLKSYALFMLMFLGPQSSHLAGLSLLVASKQNCVMPLGGSAFWGAL